MPRTAQGCAICNFTLPSGRRCASIALRGRAACRHHERSPRRIVQDSLEAKMARYRRELDSMDMPRLLEALLEKLDLICAIIPPYPEARLILGVASCRLAALMSNYFDNAPDAAHAAQFQSDPSAILTYDELEKFVSNRLQATN
jgi:hypothetical protein